MRQGNYYLFCLEIRKSLQQDLYYFSLGMQVLGLVGIWIPISALQGLMNHDYDNADGYDNEPFRRHYLFPVDKAACLFPTYHQDCFASLEFQDQLIVNIKKIVFI